MTGLPKARINNVQIQCAYQKTCIDFYHWYYYMEKALQTAEKPALQHSTVTDRYKNSQAAYQNIEESINVCCKDSTNRDKALIYH